MRSTYVAAGQKNLDVKVPAYVGKVTDLLYLGRATLSHQRCIIRTSLVQLMHEIEIFSKEDRHL